MFQPMGKNNANWKKNLGNLKKRRKGIETASKKLGEGKDMCSCDCDCGKAICESCGKPKKLDEVSNELVKKVAHKRNQNVSMAGSKADYDRRDPNYQDAAKKQDRNQKLRFARGAKAIGKVRNESARDNYNPEISDKRTKEKLKKAGLPPESPKVMEDIFTPIVEGKKKGMDGKACWNGYKLQGTKKKGNRTVDNCVPMSEEEEMKPHKMYKGDKVIVAKNKAEHDKLNKQGYTHDDPKTKTVEEAKKPVVHSTKPDSLKMVKIKYNKPIRTKVTDIGPGGKEYVRKDWSEGYNRSYRSKLKDMKADLTPKVKPSNKPIPKHLQNQIASQFKDPKDKRIAEAYPKIVKNPPSWKKTYAQGALTKKQVKDGDIRARQAREKADIKEQQIQIVTNLDFNESIGNLVRRGLDKVRSSIKDAEKSSGYKVDPSKNNTNNPVSGKNIAKRLASQKKR